MRISSMPQEQSFWRKIPISSHARRQPTCLQTVSERTAYLISQGRNKPTSEWRPSNNYINNLQSPAWHLSFPSMSWTVPLDSKKQKQKNKKAPGKAFDNVWKEGLLFKLLRKRVCGNMYLWIQSFLFQRSARVKLDGQTSSSVKTREVVPQGGVISPTLFIIFIDDISIHIHVYCIMHTISQERFMNTCI